MSGGAQPLCLGFCLGLRPGLRGVGRRSRRPGWGAASKIGRETHFALPLAFRLKWASRGRGDGPALGLPCPLSSSRPLARRPLSPWVCFLFFYPLAQREGRGREKTGEGKDPSSRAARFAAGAAWFRPSCPEEWGGARGGGNRFEFHRLFCVEADQRRARARIFQRVSNFFRKKYCKNFISPYNLGLSRVTKGLSRQAQARRFAAWQKRKKRDAVSSQKVLTKTKSEIRIRFFATQRARSSVGSECLATNQKVGGSNPSGRTTIYAANRAVGLR